MQREPQLVETHYGRGRILDSILRALAESGKDLHHLIPSDLAPVDQFHIRGRQATIELAERASFKLGQRVLDIGCGLGGSVRYLASELRCEAVGIDLTREYIETAEALATLVGLHESTQFHVASALDIPFDDASFDGAWTEHAQMNTPHKGRFYSEIARVLKPGGKLVFHDIFKGKGDQLHYPLPWAEEASISFLATPAEVRGILADLGFKILAWEDKSQTSLAWFEATVKKLKTGTPRPLGLHLLMGKNSPAKFENIIRNLREGRFLVVQAVARKDPGSSGGTISG